MRLSSKEGPPYAERHHPREADTLLFPEWGHTELTFLWVSASLLTASSQNEAAKSSHAVPSWHDALAPVPRMRPTQQRRSPILSCMFYTEDTWAHVSSCPCSRKRSHWDPILKKMPVYCTHPTIIMIGLAGWSIQALAALIVRLATWCQGSHSTWKTWKNDESFSSHGNIMEFWNFAKYGKMRRNLEKWEFQFTPHNKCFPLKMWFFQMICPLKITCIRH